MADLSKITLPDNTKLNIKDATARSGLATKQDTLVSGTNIKTINNESLLGSGNITIQGGGDSLPDQTGHSGDILTTNGTAASWMDVSEASSVNIDTSISSSSTDNTIPSSKAVYDALSNIDALPSQSGNTGKFLTTNGATVSWADLPEEIFVCIYNTTSYADVLAAYNAGKTLFCARTDGNYYYLASLVRVNSTYSASEPVFTFEYTFGNTISRFNLDNTQWWDGTFQLVPSSRTINSKNLTSDITLDASDVGAIPAPATTPSSGDILIYDGTSWTAGIPTPRPIESVSSSVYTIDNTYNHKMVEVVSNSSPAFYIQRNSFSADDEFWILNSSTSTVTVAGTNTHIYINGDNGDEVIQLNEKYQVAYFKLISTDSSNEYWVATIDSANAIPTASTTTPSMDGTASYGSGTSYARSNHVHPTDTSRAPTSHASSATTYGTGTASNYGHLKLSDSTSSTSGTLDGIAATPSAVRTAYNLANQKVSQTASAGGGDAHSLIDNTYSYIRLGVHVEQADAHNIFELTSTTTTIHNVVTPTANSDAANKQYVDNAVAGSGLPDQTGNSGKYLTTNGTTASWGATSATSTKSIDSSPTSASSNLVTSGGVYTAINNKVNRTTAVNVADTNYTTLMARGIVMLDGTTYDAVSNWSNELVNGAIAWRYE